MSKPIPYETNISSTVIGYYRHGDSYILKVDDDDDGYFLVWSSKQQSEYIKNMQNKKKFKIIGIRLKYVDERILVNKSFIVLED